MTDLIDVNAGFMPLTDSLLLVIAREQGFAKAEGIDLKLTRETSWANIRDRIGVGHFDVAHMLAPMPIAANLGLAPLPAKLIAPFTLGNGGNAVTVSKGLWVAMREEGAPDLLDIKANGAALRAALQRIGRRPRFAIVHQNSSHNLELRYWLAASGIQPDRDVEIVVLPPPLMPDALAEGSIDGYCVGEPWNSVGVALHAGRIVATKSRIWPFSPDKVLGMRKKWADENAETVTALLRAMHRSALWCGDPANVAEAAAIMSSPPYLDKPVELILRALTGHFHLGDDGQQHIPDFYVPNAGFANFPFLNDALWFYSQMVRWGDVTYSQDNAARATESFRPDLYRVALSELNVPLPTQDQRSRFIFFDAETFDASALDSYISSQRTPNE